MLIFGEEGQLGRDLLKAFGEFAPGAVAAGAGCDITDAGAVQRAVEAFAPAHILNAAAYTDVERAEDEPELAFAVNETGARHVAEAAEAAGAKVVYFSTDFVFSGNRTRPYEPSEPLAPLSVYGKSKAAGEAAIRAACARHFIVRTAWLYGPGGQNFVEKMLKLAGERPRLQVVDDEVGSPTHTWDLAEATVALCACSEFGAYHVVNEGVCSRYEFARKILALAGISVPIEPCRASAFPAKALRPAYSALSNRKYTEATGRRLRSWEEALTHYFERRKQAE